MNSTAGVDLKPSSLAAALSWIRSDSISEARHLILGAFDLESYAEGRTGLFALQELSYALQSISEGHWSKGQLLATVSGHIDRTLATYSSEELRFRPLDPNRVGFDPDAKRSEFPRAFLLLERGVDQSPHQYALINFKLMALIAGLLASTARDAKLVDKLCRDTNVALRHPYQVRGGRDMLPKLNSEDAGKLQKIFREARGITDLFVEMEALSRKLKNSRRRVGQDSHENLVKLVNTILQTERIVAHSAQDIGLKRHLSTGKAGLLDDTDYPGSVPQGGISTKTILIATNEDDGAERELLSEGHNVDQFFDDYARSYGDYIEGFEAVESAQTVELSNFEDLPEEIVEAAREYELDCSLGKLRRATHINLYSKLLFNPIERHRLFTFFTERSECGNTTLGDLWLLTSICTGLPVEYTPGLYLGDSPLITLQGEYFRVIGEPADIKKPSGSEKPLYESVDSRVVLKLPIVLCKCIAGQKRSIERLCKEGFTSQQQAAAKTEAQSVFQELTAQYGSRFHFQRIQSQLRYFYAAQTNDIAAVDMLFGHGENLVPIQRFYRFNTVKKLAEKFNQLANAYFEIELL